MPTIHLQMVCKASLNVDDRENLFPVRVDFHNCVRNKEDVPFPSILYNQETRVNYLYYENSHGYRRIMRIPQKHVPKIASNLELFESPVTNVKDVLAILEL